ncbi:MAG: hypothetical protein JWP40_3137 [Blastococcus sp.]|jgi:uncharacterized membrane protein YbhN (UPF0104 family)|nr:hypothetical protein [Blastococcus sp.]
MTSEPHGLPRSDSGGVADVGGPASASGRTRGWRRLLRPAFVGAVVIAVAALLWRQRDDVIRSLESISPLNVGESLLLGLVGAWLPGLVWRNLLASQGYPTTPAAGQRAFFVAQLGKYLPGGIWNLVAQVALARELRIPGRQAASATFLTLALSVLSALLLAGLTLPFALPELLAQYWWAFLAVPIALVMLHPRVVAWWSAAVFRLLRRPGESVRLSWPVLVRAVVLLVLSWVAFGLHFGILVRALGTDVPSLRLLSIGVFALAWVAGFLIVIAPAGAGVREAVLVFGFASFLPAGALLTMAVLSRVLLIVADVLLAGVMAATGWRGVRRHASGTAGSAP